MLRVLYHLGYAISSSDSSDSRSCLWLFRRVRAICSLLNARAARLEKSAMALTSPEVKSSPQTLPLVSLFTATMTAAT